jgi:hypothetical protein
MEVPSAVVNRFILEKSHLTNNTKTDNIVHIMEDLLGLHATNNTTPYISLFCRGENFTTEEIHENLYDSKVIAKIRCIRGTVFFQYKSIIPIMHNATLELKEKQMQKRLEYYKITPEMLADYEEKLKTLLQNNPLTTKEIRAELQTKDNLSSILFYFSDMGLIVRSKPKKNWQDRMPTYELFEEAVPHLDLNSISIADAQIELIAKYIEKYGPVCEKDIVWWTGLNKTTVRNAMETLDNQITEISLSDFKNSFYIWSEEYKILQEMKPLHESVISLLPCLDPYIMGYKIRNRYIPEFGKEYIFDRSGNATNVIILNGKIVGIWDWEPKKSVIKYFIFGEVTHNQSELIHAETERMGNFLFLPPFEIVEKIEMEHLTNRTAGWVLKPLRD